MFAGENGELFRLVVGGYGLFGVVADVTVRLSPRGRVRRCVDEAQTDEIVARFEEEAGSGTLYGDYQFAIDDESPDFLQRGIFSRYRPVVDDTPIPEGQRRFTPELWLELTRAPRDRIRSAASHMKRTRQARGTYNSEITSTPCASPGRSASES